MFLINSTYWISVNLTAHQQGGRQDLTLKGMKIVEVDS